MPQFQLVDNDTGRQMVVESDTPPSESEVALLFQNYDAYKVTTAGPKGSEERRRAMSQEVAAQAQQSFAEGSGGATASTGTTMGASLGRSLSEAGTKLMGGVARGFEMLKEGLGSPEGGFTTVNPEINPATRSPEQIEQDIAANRLYQQAQELESQAKAFYPVNPDKPWANLPGQAIGSAAQMLATGPARIPAYALSALESGAQSALEAGATPAQAQAQGLVEGAMGGASEKLLGLAPFLKEVGGKTLREVGRMGGRAVGRVMAQEAIQEPTEGILNRLSSKYVTGANPNEVVLDPQTLAMEATGGALGAASIQIPTIGAARIQRQRDVMGRREMGLAGRSEQQLQAELEAFNRGIQQSQLVGGEGALVQSIGNQFPNQLDLSQRSDLPSEVSGLEQPFGRKIGRYQIPAGPSAKQRRAELEAGMELPQDSGKFPEPPPPRYAQAPQLATLGTAPRTQLTTSPIDEAILSGRLQRSTLPPINPDLQRLQDAAEAELNAIERFPNRDTRRRDALLGAAPQVIQMLDTRINNSIGTVSDAEVGRLMDLRERLARFYNDQTAYNQLTAEAIGIARDTRRPAPRMAAGLSQLEQSRQAQFPAAGAAIQPEQPQSILPQGDLMSRLREARKMDELRQPSPMSAAALGTGQPVGGPPALNPMTDWLQVYEAAQNQVQTPAPLSDEQRVTPQPQAEAEAPQGDQVRQGQAARRVGRRVNLRAPKPKKSSQTTTGSNVQTGTEMPVQPPAGEAPLSRSEPAAAQGVATEGAATPAGAGVAAFETRKYGGKLFVDQATYNRMRPLIDQKIAEGDETAKRIDKLEVNAGDLVKLSNTFFLLSPEGQDKVRVKFGNKLYQSVDKWLNGEEFKFSPSAIAQSLSKDVYGSKAEREYRATIPGESTEEGGEETIGPFDLASTRQSAVQKLISAETRERLSGPRTKAQEDVVLALASIARTYNLSRPQMENVIAAVEGDLDVGQLTDEELAAFEGAGQTLSRLKGIMQFSVSSLIREPIGLARAQQAVDKWKLETGAVGARIEVVEDPDLTTPDGRPVAAMVETRPGELPLITINAAHIASEEEVREKLWHEALHPVWGDAGVQAAWAEVLKALPASAVQAELARGYSPLEATMEAAINAASIRAANTPVRSAWQKFLDAVWEALSRVFGFETKPKDFERLMEEALRSLSRPYNQAQSTQYAEQLTQQDAEYLAAVQRGDMATAQRMVDEAAKAAGYNVGPVYHNTNRDFTEFQGSEFWFSDDPDAAAALGARRVSAYLKIQNPGNAYDLISRRKGQDGSKDAVVYQGNFRGVGSNTGNAWVVFSPSQIKSADPVTYDDAGNPIPLSRRFQQDNPDIRYSVANSFAMAKNPAEIQKRLETSSDPESLLAMGRAVASLITPEFQQLVASVEDAAPGTPEAAMRTFLKRAGQIAQTGGAVVQWGLTHETPIPSFQSIGDLPAEWQGVVGNAMTGAHFALGQQVKSIDRAIEKTAEELTRVAADFSEADEKRLVAEATKSEAKRLLDGLLRLIEVERKKLGTSSQTLSKEEADAAAMAVSQIKRGKLAVLSKGLETMAREMPIAGFTSNAEALAWLRSRQQTSPIFGQDAQDAYNALEKALQRQPDLTKRIEQIRALTLDNVDAVREVGQLGKLLGKNKGNTIKNYAKLRADYESAFRQFKSLSDRMDRLSNRMDGLLRAKEALVNLTTSPEYNAKLGEVFGNNKAMLSGLMAPVTERGQPTGVIEFYGPSAYNANGGIKPGGKVAVYGDPGFEKADGLIYRIDWKPDFAIERKNVEAITGLIRELADALYNPESKNALKDPLARASYERVLNYVQKFLVDNRYLTEQQWKDSILLTGLKAGGIGSGLPGLLMQFAGSLYTTRMNAARASGGRGGAQWEEANKAVDTFEKKSENTLRDTRTENAEARRAAIESHGLNPDDPMAIEEWSAHISAVIGSMQNPSQDQLKEGDYVGGMQVTKEDLRSARIQKQFSSGIVSDFNNMATSFAEVVNPEEQIGGILFTRAAEDYGMKTRREFSQWGREFADLWEIATEADLRAFRAKQANATGDEQVQMVWDEREKLANKQIAGPVWSHISETNSEFTSKDSNQLKAAFSRIRKDLKAGRTDGLQTVNAIASTIAELTADENGEGGLNPLEAKVELLQAIDRDVKGYMRAANEFKESGFGGSNLPDAIMSVKAANGALALARGKMVAPTWFYDYGIHDDYKRAAEVANGKRILLMKVYETMTAYRNAVKRKLDEAEREIRENAAKLGRDGRPVGLARAEKEYDRKASAQYKEGGIFATRRMLEANLKLVEGQLSELKNHLAMSSGVAVEQAVAGAARAFLGGLRSVLLSSVNSIINNLTSTTLDTYRTWDTTNRFWLKLFSIARANGRLLRFVASDMVAALPASIRNKLSKRQKSFLLDVIPRMLEGTMEERRMMEDAGLAPSFESYASIYRRIKANPLTFGSTRTPANSPIERMAAQLYSKMAFAVALGSWVKERSPGYFDSLLNRTIASDSTAFVEWLTPHLLSWARSQPGETVEEKVRSALESTLTPESIGVTTEGLALIRDYMSGAGSLESIAARALNDNGLEGLSRPNGLSKAEMEAIQFDAGRKYNIRASSTTPDIAKGGAGIKGVASNVLHMFMGWVLQRMGSDANQFFKTKGGGWKKELAVAWGAVVLLLVTLMAGALYKIPKDIWRAITGNPATTPNILQAVDSPEMALRYLAASTAGVFPVGGGIAAELLGGSGISSPLNNNFLDNNPAAGFLASLLATGKRVYQTGDLKYPLVDFTRKNFWPAGVVMNYTMPGDVEARGAARAVRMGATGMEVRPTGGGVGARETPATPLVRDAVAALYEGDSAAYQQARQKFIAYQVRQGKTQREAEKRFDSSVSGRDPLRSVLGRQPTEEEEATILRRLTTGQRKTVTKARSLFRKPKKVRIGGARKSRRIRLGRRRPARRSVRLRRSAS